MNIENVFRAFEDSTKLREFKQHFSIKLFQYFYKLGISSFLRKLRNSKSQVDLIFTFL
jgi:hypothetical protein